MKSFAIAALAGFASFTTSSPVRPSRTTIQSRQDNGTSSAPCAQVSQYMYGDGTTVVKTEMPAKMAFDCLTTIPFNATAGKSLIAAIRPYVLWQSTLDVLKSPPTEYVQKVQPPIDILGGLDKIVADIDAGRFSDEYDFGWTLYTLIQSAHDGHFSYIPDSVGSIFQWGRPVPLVSVSADGKQLPAVFAFDDLLGMQYKNISYTPSPVVELDGQDVYKWIENFSQYGSLQDRDALYNNVFYSLAQVSLAGSGTGTGMFTGGGRGRYVYPHSTTTLKFANGSDYTMQNYARAMTNFRGISSGEDLRKVWYYGDAPSQVKSQSVKPQTLETISTAAIDGTTGAPPGYPNPIVAGPVNLINGFFIDASGYQDIAVLTVPNFVGSGSYAEDFQKTSQDFFARALAAGKTKLIIDLQANGGGTILQGYDMFKQLFPDVDPYGGNRFRAIEAVNLIGNAFSTVASRAPRGDDTNASIRTAQTSYFDYHTDMTEDGKPFTSWSEKFGPQEINGGESKKKST